MCPFFPTTILVVKNDIRDLFWPIASIYLCMHLKSSWEICLDFGPPQEHLQRCAQFVTLWKYFSHPSFCSVLFWCNPTNKTETGDSKYVGGLLITNHLDRSLWCANQKHWAAVRSYLLHSFLQVGAQCCCFYQPWHGAQIMLSQKPISWAKPANVRWYSSSNFTLQDHIPSTPLEMVRCKKIVPCNFGTPTKGKDTNFTWTCHICSLGSVASANRAFANYILHRWTS
jgi:hypothetical protein